VAVAVRGWQPTSTTFSNGNLAIFNAADGTLITNISKASNHDHTDVAWDNVGNVYDLDNFDSRWRVYSPPGTNQASTVAVEMIQVLNSFLPPLLSNIALVTNEIQFDLMGQPNVTYVILASTNLFNWDTVGTNYDANPVRKIQFPATDEQRFYRARVSP
jgi:hypothetical protein